MNYQVTKSNQVKQTNNKLVFCFWDESPKALWDRALQGFDECLEVDAIL